MSLLSRLFGGKTAAQDPVSEDYNGFRIFVEPMKEGGRYRIAARIEREVDGVTKVHQVIRADTLETLEGAVKVSRAKAMQVIDEQGMNLFK